MYVSFYENYRLKLIYIDALPKRDLFSYYLILVVVGFVVEVVVVVVVVKVVVVIGRNVVVGIELNVVEDIRRFLLNSIDGC